MNLKLIILINFICLSAIAQKADSVNVLPGKGIIFNKDTILLNKTTIKETCKILNIKHVPNPKVYPIRNWDGIDAGTGKSVSGSDYCIQISFKSMIFTFSDESDKDNLKLESIEIKANKSLYITTNTGLEMGMINPKIKEIYPKVEKIDYISDDELTYSLNSYGVLFILEKSSNNNLKLIEISIHKK